MRIFLRDVRALRVGDPLEAEGKDAARVAPLGVPPLRLDQEVALAPPRLRLFGFRVQGLGFRVQGLGFRVQGLGLRVSGLEFRV